MLTGLESLSVRNKLIFTSMLVTGLAILVGMVISIVEDVRNTSHSTKEHLIVLTDMAAANSASALAFNDAKAAKETLSVLSTNRIITRADVIDENQNIFATFESEVNQQASWMSEYPFLTRLTIERPVTLKGSQLGTLLVVADMASVWDTLITQWLVKFSVLSTIFLMSYLVLRNTSSYVLGPIQRLAKAIREISDSGDYSLRVVKTSTDELGLLTEEFNSMLTQIEDRDSQLQQSNEALAQVQEPIVLTDINLNCEYVNPAFTSTFGYTLAELKGHKFSLEVKNRAKTEFSEAEAYNIAKNEGVHRGEVNRQTKDGRILPVKRHISPVRDKSGEVKGYVTVLTDISEQKDAEELIWRQANFDTLTGLPNRLMFTHRLKQELSKVSRSKLPLALMFLDLDRFKEINDTLGHDVGDALLKEVAKRILRCLRGSGGSYMENVARLGGDEFTIVLSELKNISGTEVVAKRVLEQLAQPFQLGKEVVHISASIGVVETFPDQIIDTDTLIKHADIAMYDAKQKGRNRFSRFDKSMLIETQKRRRLINDIHKGLENGEFYLVYQPIIDIHTNELFKAEALIRWQHPTEGAISPVDFISVAEDAGLIVELGDWVFHEAAKQVAKWRQTINKDFQISINKSPIQLHNTDKGGLNWFDCLKDLGLPGESVIVEITEGVFLNKNAVVTDKLLKFREAGMQISLDDFGTGYSSLSYLLKFDIDYIKIDRSFVNNLTINRQDLVLCEAMIVMAHKLGIKVVAEGIETQVQLGMLSEAGCDYAQGYLLAKPLSPNEFERFHKNRDTGSYMQSA